MSRANDASSGHRSGLAEGTRLHNYVIERVLGSGGFGITYMAREDITGRAVAIKEYLPSALAVRVRDGLTVQPVSEGTRPDFEWGLTRFRQEAKLLLSLRHPNIVPSLNYFETNGTAYLVMEYQEGQTLTNVMGGGITLEESEVREFIGGLLDGVEAVHKAGLLHRDIKPDNIFIRRDGTPVLIDFGSARQALGHHSHSLTAVVTDGYAPFEQYERAGDQGPWTDIYAIGAVLFRCLVGHRPPTATKRLSAQYRGGADPAAQGFATLRQRCSRALVSAVEAALAVNGEDRPQTVADFRALLADTGARATVRRAEAAAPTLLAGTSADRSREGTLVAQGTAIDAGRGATLVSEPPRRRRVWPIWAALGVLLLGGGAAAAYLGVGGIVIPGFTDTRAADAEAKRKAEEAARLAAEQEAKRKAEEEEAKRKADDEKRRAEEEAQRRADEDAKRRADEDAKRRAEDEARRKRDEEAAKRTEDEKRRADEARRRDDERRRAEDEAKRKSDEDKRKAEDEAKRRADEETRRKAEEDRAKNGAARASWYAPERNRGVVYFAYKSATVEPSAAAALTRLVADARGNANYRIVLVAVSERSEGAGADAVRLRAQRLDAVRVWLVARGIDSDRIRVAHGGMQTEGADHRYVSVAFDVQTASTDRPTTPDRPGNGERPRTDRPGDRPGTPDTTQRYSRAELQARMYRLIKGAAYSGNIRSENEGVLSGGDGLSGLAVCVNWGATTPERAVIGGAYSWTARSGSLITERALAGCRSMGGSGCQCVMVEAGSSNVLVLPESFVQRYGR